MTYTRTSHRGAIETVWLHFSGHVRHAWSTHTLCTGHLDSERGMRERQGSWEMCEPRSEWVEEAAVRPFHPLHTQPHTLLYQWVSTPHFLDSGLRAELIFPPPPTHEHTCTSLSLTHEFTSSITGYSVISVCKGNIVKRQGRSDKGGRESKNEMCRDQNRLGIRNRHSNKLLCAMDVTSPYTSWCTVKFGHWKSVNIALKDWCI